jgi:hypothetical protein
MEGGPLQDARVKKLIEEDYVELWLHFDHDTLGEKHRALQKDRFVGFLSSPYWAIVDPTTEQTIRKQDFTLDVEEFLRFLRGE